LRRGKEPLQLPAKRLAKEQISESIITEIFRTKYKGGGTPVEFSVKEYGPICEKLGIPRLGNPPDLAYGYRFRFPLPPSIEDTQPPNRFWNIELAGKGRYRFVLRRVKWIDPTPGQLVIKVPDQTPEIIKQYALTDEQSLLAKVRYNRLIDIFLGISASSLQSHLRTTVEGLASSQIEIDELYVGVNTNGVQLVVPVQAKRGAEHLASVQARQDLMLCSEKWPNATCRAVSAAFPPSEQSQDTIVLFELALEGDEVIRLREKQYQLVERTKISPEDLMLYKTLKID
jgi:hypothetical protein